MSDGEIYLKIVYGYVPICFFTIGGILNTVTIITLWGDRRTSPTAILLIGLEVMDSWVILVGMILFVIGK